MLSRLVILKDLDNLTVHMYFEYTIRCMYVYMEVIHCTCVNNNRVTYCIQQTNGKANTVSDMYMKINEQVTDQYSTAVSEDTAYICLKTAQHD